MSSNDLPGRCLRDRGVTLTELLITITIAGIVTSVLAGGIVMFLRNEASVSRRVDQTRGLQQLVNYFPADVASAQTIAVDGGADACGTDGTPVLHLGWTETFDTTTRTWRVSYRSTVLEESRLTRFACEEGSSVPTSTVQVASGFTSLEVNSATFADGRVLMTIQFPEARRTIVSQSRNISGGT